MERTTNPKATRLTAQPSTNTTKAPRDMPRSSVGLSASSLPTVVYPPSGMASFWFFSHDLLGSVGRGG